MAGATANREVVSVGKESTVGTAATTGDIVRMTDCNVKGNSGTTTSNEIRSDRQVAAIIELTQDAGGAISGEMAYDEGAAEQVFEAGLYSTAWTSGSTPITSVAVTVVGAGTNTLSGTGLSAAFAPGDLIRLEGGSSNDGILCYVTADSGSDVLTVLPSKTLTASSASIDISLLSSITSGNTRTSLTVQRHWTDITTSYLVGVGLEVDTLTFSSAVGSIPTWQCSFLGLDADFLLSPAIASPNAASTSPVVSPTTGVTIGIDGEAATVVRNLEISIANSPRSVHVIDGQAKADSIGHGQAVVSGTCTLLFDSVTTAAKVNSFTTVDLIVGWQDGSGNHRGNGYCMVLPSMKLTDADVPNQGKDTDMEVTLAFSGFLDSDISSAVKMGKFTNS